MTSRRSNATHSAFQTFEWFDTWWSAFGPRHRLFLLTIHQAGSIIGIVPLMRVRGPLGLRQLEFIGTPNADYQDLIIPERRDEAVRAVCEFLHGVRGRWDMIVLRNLPSGSPTIGRIARRVRATRLAPHGYGASALSHPADPGPRGGSAAIAEPLQRPPQRAPAGSAGSAGLSHARHG